MQPSDFPLQTVTDDDARSKILARCLALEISAEQAADLLGPRVAVVEVILETRGALWTVAGQGRRLHARRTAAHP